MREWRLISLSVLLCVGCTQSDTPVNRDAQNYDAGRRTPDAETATAVTDIQPVDVDAQNQGTMDQAVMTDTAFRSIDQGEPQFASDSTVRDSQVLGEADSTVAEPIRRSRGQCALDEDCDAVGSGNASCSRVFPGGACTGCGQDDECPSGSECSAFGACVSMCQDDDDCPAGTLCLGSGRCAQQRCNQDVCPDPRYDCNDSSRCQRRSCSDESNCDESMFCLDNLCVSNAWR